MIGLFLNNAAQISYQQVLVRQSLAGEPVRRFMNPNPIVVPGSLDLHDWVEHFVYRSPCEILPVVSNERLEGCVETSALLADTPRRVGPSHCRRVDAP